MLPFVQFVVGNDALYLRRLAFRNVLDNMRVYDAVRLEDQAKRDNLAGVETHRFANFLADAGRRGDSHYARFLRMFSTVAVGNFAAAARAAMR